MYLPKLQAPNLSRINTETFGGYNHNLRILSGEWYDETNITSSYYPLFSQRDKRGVIKTLTNPLGMLAKDALMYIDGTKLYYNDAKVAGISLSTASDMLPKQIISMGAYAIIFPDKVYVNTKDLTDHGTLDATFTSVTGADVTYQMCRVDGTNYDTTSATIGADAPANPTNGQFWIDTSADIHVLKQYSTTTSQWVSLVSVYTKIGAPNIGKNFGQYDGVKLSGCAYTGDNDALEKQISDLNKEHTIYTRGDDYIVVVGLLDQAYTQQAGAVTVKRESPKMQYVIESENRLWGCFYGMDGGDTINQIYACKLGDFKNWNCFMGLSTDSYAVTVGTDGTFTGAVAYQGKPMFFKEGCIHQISGSMPEQYTLYTDTVRGVQAGSWRSVVVVSEKVFYKSRNDVCYYDGSTPTSISGQMGDVGYTDAVAGTNGSKYYISMKDGAGAWHMFAFDTYRGVWHREDATRALVFTEARGELLYIDATTKKLVSVNGASGTLETSVSWSAESGLMGYEYPDQQYMSRFNIRVKLGNGSTLALALQYDSSGVWVDMGTYTGNAKTDTITIPVKPLRCDHLRLKLSGTGDVKIYSIARYLEVGSDV